MAYSLSQMARNDKMAKGNMALGNMADSPSKR